MLLMNAGDEPLRATWSERPPEIQNDTDIHFPPRAWVFEPGKVQDVPDAAGRLFLEKHRNWGLVQMNSVDDDRDELRRIGRLQMLSFLDHYLSEFVRENDERESTGQFRIPASPGIKKMLNLRNKIDAEFNGAEAAPKDMDRDLNPQRGSEKKRRTARAAATLDDLEAARQHGDELI